MQITPRIVAIAITIALAVGTLLYALQPSLFQREEETATAALTMLNYGNVDVYASVEPAQYPPQDGYGAGYGLGPHAGGGIMCCIEIPVKWRPGIKMRVMYQFGDEPKENWYTRIVELPPYPNGKGGNLWLSFFNDRSFELISSHYGPEDPDGNWPGRIKKFPGRNS